jgi:uncharacterized membrane protein YjfL (UPF0719 family)
MRRRVGFPTKGKPIKTGNTAVTAMIAKTAGTIKALSMAILHKLRQTATIAASIWWRTASLRVHTYSNIKIKDAALNVKTIGDGKKTARINKPTLKLPLVKMLATKHCCSRLIDLVSLRDNSAIVDMSRLLA